MFFCWFVLKSMTLRLLYPQPSANTPTIPKLHKHTHNTTADERGASSLLQSFISETAMTCTSGGSRQTRPITSRKTRSYDSRLNRQGFSKLIRTGKRVLERWWEGVSVMRDKELKKTLGGLSFWHTRWSGEGCPGRRKWRGVIVGYTTVNRSRRKRQPHRLWQLSCLFAKIERSADKRSMRRDVARTCVSMPACMDIPDPWNNCGRSIYQTPETIVVVNDHKAYSRSRTNMLDACLFFATHPEITNGPKWLSVLILRLIVKVVQPTPNIYPPALIPTDTTSCCMTLTLHLSNFSNPNSLSLLYITTVHLSFFELLGKNSLPLFPTDSWLCG